MGYGGFVYNVLLLLHLLAAVVGFGSSFVWPVLAAKARGMSPAEGFALSSTAFSLGKPLTTYPIYATGAFGILMLGVAVADDTVSSPYGFDQTWISAAFALFIIAVCVAQFLHYPNLKAMQGLQERLVSGEAQPTPNGPPAEVLELQERGKQAGMYGGILHLLFLLLMIDMVWKPGSGY